MSTRPVAAFAAAILVFATAVPAAADENLEQVRKRISAEFEVIDPENINPSPVDGWYTIQQGTIVAYVSGDGRYLLQGDLIDLDSQVNLTEAARDDARKELVGGLTDDEVITFGPDDAEYSVTVFTDVGCTFCRRLHNQIDEYNAAGIAVRYVLYPRNGPASPDWAESERVWCASDRKSALTAAKADKDFPSSDCDASIVQDHFLLGQQVGLSGTPAIVLEDGELISGYLPPEALAAKLQSVTQQAKR
jgi:thiol:disulfide interchange protein DsbC